MMISLYIGIILLLAHFIYGLLLTCTLVLKEQEPEPPKHLSHHVTPSSFILRHWTQK